MSKIRLWKLGKITNNPLMCILPTESVICKLKTLLREARNSSGEFVDIVWGPDIECQVLDGDKDTILSPIVQEDGYVLYRLENIGEKNESDSSNKSNDFC